jgi:hypothetical protein
MSPLIFLLLRRIKNGIFRSFKTPVRAGMTVLFAGYILFAVFTVVTSTFKTPSLKVESTFVDPGVVVAVITLCHLFLVLYILPSAKHLFIIFSDVDVANLYPAPLERWRVFRFFLFTRSFLVAFLFLGAMAVYIPFFFRIAMPKIFFVVQLQHQIVWIVLYIFLILTAVAGLMFWRLVVDIRTVFGSIHRYSFRLIMTIFLGVITTNVVVSLYVSYTAGYDAFHGLAIAVESFPLNIILAPFRVFADLFLNNPELVSFQNMIAAMLWIFFACSGYKALQSQSNDLYEYGARLAAHRAHLVAQMRNPALMLKENRTEGKEALRLPWLMNKLTLRGAGAIFWRDMIVAWRSLGITIRWFHRFLLFSVVFGWASISWMHLPIRNAAVWTIAIATMGISIFAFAVASTMGLSHILQRVEVQKPMPLSAQNTVTMHILLWTMVIWMVTFMPFVAAAILFIQHWMKILFVMIVGWSFAHTILSAYFWVTLYNPDQNDPIQRMYGGIFGLLLSIVSMIPGGVVLTILSLLHLPLVIQLVGIIAINLCSSALLHYLSARKYVNFVPSE